MNLFLKAIIQTLIMIGKNHVWQMFTPAASHTPEPHVSFVFLTRNRMDICPQYIVKNL